MYCKCNVDVDVDVNVNVNVDVNVTVMSCNTCSLTLRCRDECNGMECNVMYTCMLCMYVCMHACMHVCIYFCRDVVMCACMYRYTHICKGRYVDQVRRLIVLMRNRCRVRSHERQGAALLAPPGAALVSEVGIEAFGRDCQRQEGSKRAEGQKGDRTASGPST